MPPSETASPLREEEAAVHQVIEERVLGEARETLGRALVHDLANIVTGMNTLSEALIEEIPEDDPNVETVQYLADSTARIMRLLRRVDAVTGRREREMEVLDLHAWLEEELPFLRILMRSPGKVEIARPCGMVPVEVAPGVLRDLLLLLVRLAQQQAEGPAELRLALQPAQREANLHVGIVGRQLMDPPGTGNSLRWLTQESAPMQSLMLAIQSLCEAQGWPGSWSGEGLKVRLPMASESV